jgi:hypothetical protein
LDPQNDIIIKMDIEGAEVLAFEGMQDIMSMGHTKIFWN